MRELLRARARSLAWTICIAVSIAPIVGEAAVGRTQSNATVSPTGEASYSIPIFAPPGTHGMTPQMALVYGHRNGGTLVGAGWSIAGLSAITRCPRIGLLTAKRGMCAMTPPTGSVSTATNCGSLQERTDSRMRRTKRRSKHSRALDRTVPRATDPRISSSRRRTVSSTSMATLKVRGSNRSVSRPFAPGR